MVACRYSSAIVDRVGRNRPAILPFGCYSVFVVLRGVPSSHARTAILGLIIDTSHCSSLDGSHEDVVSIVFGQRAATLG